MLDENCIVQYVLSTKRDKTIDEHNYNGFLPRVNDSLVYPYRGNFRSFQVMNVTIEPRVRAVVVLTPPPLSNQRIVLPILEQKVFSEVQHTSTAPPPTPTFLGDKKAAFSVADIRRKVRDMQPGQDLVFNVTRIPHLDMDSLLALLEVQGYDTRIVSGHLTVTRLLDE